MNSFLDPFRLGVESARLALQWSKRYCRAIPGGKSDCAWCHGFWPIPRALGIGRVMGGHANFLLRVLREHARRRTFGRVLVSATADHSMPALVYRAYEAEGVPLDLCVLDWCETPLALSRWYAEGIAWPVRTICADVLAYEAPEAFDLVLTNSFLGYFAPAMRIDLFRRWAGLLRPGGAVVFTNRVRDGAAADLVGFTPAEAERFVAEIEAKVEVCAPMLGIDAAEILAGARAYASRFQVHPVTSHDQLHAQLGAAGFALEQSDAASIVGTGAGLSGPSTNEGGTYARILAYRQ